jgi:hypothetical protein
MRLFVNTHLCYTYLTFDQVALKTRYAVIRDRVLIRNILIQILLVVFIPLSYRPIRCVTA